MSAVMELIRFSGNIDIETYDNLCDIGEITEIPLDVFYPYEFWSCCKRTRSRRLERYKIMLKKRVKNLGFDPAQIVKYESKFWLQGWRNVFDKRIFKTTNSTFYAFDLDEAKKMMNRYVKKREAIDKVIELWEDGDILLIGW